MTGPEVLTTKLHPAATAPDWVWRPRLVDALEACWHTPLALVSAPAGYGKSVLVTQWAAAHQGRVAWVELDGRDSDPKTFGSYIVAAVHALAPGALAPTEELLGGWRAASAADIARCLANDLDALDGPLAVVLEDYHRVRSVEINELLAGVLMHAPANVVFAILTRHDPALPLAQLRGSGRVTEIRAADLCFTPPEASALLANVLETPVSEATGSSFIEATEGWAAGLRLAAEARRHTAGEPEPPSTAHPLDARAIHDYLIAEVLERQPPWVRARLLATSVAPSFDASLCDELVDVLDEPDSDDGAGRAFVEYVARRDLFAVRLRDGTGRLRYHDLFADLLRGQLAREHGDAAADALRARAIRSLEKRGMLEDAIEIAAGMGSPERLAEVVARHGSHLAERDDWRRLEAWLALLPRDVVESSPDLLVLEAWVAGELLENPVEMRDRLTRAESLIASARPGLAVLPATSASIEALRGLLAFIEGDPHEAIRRAQRGGAHMPTDLHRHLTFTVVLECAALQASGDVRNGLSCAFASMTARRPRETPFEPWTWALPYVHWLEADIAEVQHWGEVLESRGRESGLVDTQATGRYFQGIAAYERNDLDTAERFLEVPRGHRERLRPVVYVETEVVLGLAHIARGRVEDAERIADDLTLFTRRSANPRLVLLADSFGAEVALAGGLTPTAARWAARADIGSPRQEWYRHAPATSLVRALLAAESNDALTLAEDVLSGRLAFAGRVHNRPRLAQLLALLARVHEARGHDDAARAALMRAVDITEPGQTVRLVADAGPHLSGLLSRLDVTGGRLDHVARILAASPEQRDTHLSGLPGDGVAATRFAAGGDDMLTDREAQVLVLLDRRMSNKEIARELLVSPATVKKNTISIYRKLHVPGRRAAADKARALGYLEDARAHPAPGGA